MAIPVYNSLAEIYAAIQTEWPDNTSRLVTAEKVRDVVNGIVNFFGTLYPDVEIIPLNGDLEIEIDLTAARVQRYGRIPHVDVYVMDTDLAQYTIAPLPVSLDAAPVSATKLIVRTGGNSDGFIILK